MLLDPLTGNPVDPMTGQPVPGSRGGGELLGSAIRRQLVAAVQNGRFATSASLGQVLDRVAATDYSTDG